MILQCFHELFKPANSVVIWVIHTKFTELIFQEFQDFKTSGNMSSLIQKNILF